MEQQCNNDQSIFEWPIQSKLITIYFAIGVHSTILISQPFQKRVRSREKKKFIRVESILMIIIA